MVVPRRKVKTLVHKLGFFLSSECRQLALIDISGWGFIFSNFHVIIADGHPKIPNIGRIANHRQRFFEGEWDIHKFIVRHNDFRDFGSFIPWINDEGNDIFYVR